MNLTAHVQNLRDFRINREKETKYKEQVLIKAAKAFRPHPYAPSVITRRAAKSGKKTRQWLREHPKLVSSIPPPWTASMGL